MPKIPKTDKIPYNWLRLAKDPLNFFASRTHANKGVSDMGFFINMKSILLNTPEDIEYVLVKNNRNYVKGKVYDSLRIVLGNGLLTSEGEFWRRQRRIAQPAFHKHVVAGFAESINDIIDDLLRSWQKKLEEGKSEFDVAAEMMKLTVRITSNLLFGTDVKDKEAKVLFLVGEMNERSVARQKNPFRLPFWLPLPAHLKFKKYKKELDLIVNNIISKRRALKGNKPHDLLQLLMDATDEETGERMNDKQLRDEVMTLFLAGSETSSNALAWTLYLLCKNRDKEEIAKAEIKKVSESHKTGLENIKDLHYLNLCFQESMRLYPPAWFISREAISDDLIGGYFIPKKSQLYISIHGMHTHPDYWNNPLKFEPERFEDKDRPKYCYFPFGGGPRLCIGAELARMEVLLTLYKLLRAFTFELTDQSIEPEPLITLRPKSGLKMKVQNAAKV